MTASVPFDASPQLTDIINYRGGHLQVVACAGSGKTESISRRVASLVVEGVEPCAIVAFTFTQRAAASLKARITRRVAEAKDAEFLDRLGPTFVGTIHSYCMRLLQEHVPQYGNHDGVGTASPRRPRRSRVQPTGTPVSRHPGPLAHNRAVPAQRRRHRQRTRARREDRGTFGACCICSSKRPLGTSTSLVRSGG